MMPMVAACAALALWLCGVDFARARTRARVHGQHMAVWVERWRARLTGARAALEDEVVEEAARDR